MRNRGDMIRGGLYVIVFQIFGAGILFFVLYHNYQSITNSSSIQEHYKKTFVLDNKKSVTSNLSRSVGSGELIYTGALGSIRNGNHIIGREYSFKDISYRDININVEMHNNLVVLLQSITDKRFYGKMYIYLMKNTSSTERFMAIVNDLNFLSKYTKLPLITSNLSNVTQKIDNLLLQKDDKSLIQYFQRIEQLSFERIQTGGMNRSIPLLQSEKFAYIYNQIHVDNNKKYTTHIALASKIFSLNPSIIEACIMVEQLRAFYTFKGLFKSVARTNTYLTVMSKQSFGIGGMKLATAEQFENWLAYKDPVLYQTYFAYSDTKNISQQRLSRLTDSQNYYYQILYTAGLLYQYKSERSQAGISLDYRPGILATMYNIGYSKPHKNADIGGAFMNIEGERYSFGGLAMLIYYYLEIFGNE